MPKLKHIAIITLEPEKLEKFYTEVFDMKVLNKTKTGGVYLTDGYINLALLPNRAEGKPSGINHFGFHVEDADEITKRLADWGIDEPAERPRNRPYAETRGSDPDGNNIDISVHGFGDIEYAADRERATKKKLETVEN